jgi:hypothetical protein
MKSIFYLTIFTLLFANCRSSKDFLARSDEDKALLDAVKTLNKKSTDENAIKALPILYTNAEKRHLGKISTLSTYQEINRYGKMLDEYNIMQRMYEAISNSATASRYVHPVSYENDISLLKQDAAAAYYSEAAAYLGMTGRDNAKTAYNYFKKSTFFIANYKDAKEKMNEAYSNGTVDIVINPVHDNSFFFNSGWGNGGYNYSNEYFQQTLIRELGGTYASRYPARFYTDWDARRQNVQPNWVVDLTLRNLDIPRPSGSQYSRNVSQQVENGKDSSGRVIYQTVYATLNINKQYFTARGEIEVNITDVNNRKNICYNTYSDDYRWEQEYATYTGDSRALSSSDWALVNNRNNFTQPKKEEVLNELYRKLYPQIKNRISYAVDW